MEANRDCGRKLLLALAVGLMLNSQALLAQCWNADGPHLQEGRATLGGAADALGRIYAIGGQDRSETPLDTVERFDEENGEVWEFIDRLNERRGQLGAAVDCRGRIYAISGLGIDRLLNTVERYDPADENAGWQFVKPLRIARAELGAASSGGYIYAIGGGIGENVFTATVERYDPCEDRWDFIKPLNVARISFGTAVDDVGRIYVIGGRLTNGQHLRSVEMYDPARPEQGWVLLPEKKWLLGPARHVGACSTGPNGLIYVMGGWEPGYMKRVDRYRPILTPEFGPIRKFGKWLEHDPDFDLAESNNNMGSAVSRSGTIYVFGGDRRWETVQRLFVPRKFARRCNPK